jgi:hypothetical protein
MEREVMNEPETSHVAMLQQMLKELERDSPSRMKPIRALRAAIAALEQPAAPPPAIREIVVRLGGTINATRFHYVLHENGLATRYVDKPTAFESASAAWKVEGDKLEIAFT